MIIHSSPCPSLRASNALYRALHRCPVPSHSTQRTAAYWMYSKALPRELHSLILSLSASSLSVSAACCSSGPEKSYHGVKEQATLSGVPKTHQDGQTCHQNRRDLSTLLSLKHHVFAICIGVSCHHALRMPCSRVLGQPRRWQPVESTLARLLELRPHR